ncbi:hypothetical protein H6F76_14170 [Leptolyngbya sp. FACHB-321]|uniref:hypothetical protein n=1 Tax=Leptolyngbya sp. FACHB-321 TaxID=2692807 RepID=UPI001688BE3F|nr:hypothetical protein [Leptolyngbya sp. FACHB-321]MBD2036165.1 hypothetical protein [Leptolyngbya sp. FACHB-321]
MDYFWTLYYWETASTAPDFFSMRRLKAAFYRCPSAGTATNQPNKPCLEANGETSSA